MDECTFCEEIKTEQFHGEGLDMNRTLLSTDHFLVVPALGPLGPGHLLILSKEHYLAVGQLSDPLLSEFEGLQIYLRRTLERHYGAPVFFEHGPALYRKGAGCCIEHLHMAAFPSSIDLTNQLRLDFAEQPIQTLRDLKKPFEARTPYLYFETANEKRHLFLAPDYVPSQYFRRLIASAHGEADHWNWRDHPDLEEMMRTFQMLKKRL
ncbi:MAG: hypothetical protein AABX70_01100 [Nanoarchaeota archaeon]